jgi:hypothetical protein
MPDAKLYCHFETGQSFTVIATRLMHSDISDFSDVMKDIQDAIWCGSFVLHPAEQISLCIGFLKLDSHLGRVPVGEPFAKLSKLDQTRARIILKIAFGKTSQI